MVPEHPTVYRLVFYVAKQLLAALYHSPQILQQRRHFFLPDAIINYLLHERILLLLPHSVTDSLPLLVRVNQRFDVKSDFI